MITRLSFLFFVGLSITACSSSEQSAPTSTSATENDTTLQTTSTDSEKVVNIYNWSDYVAEDTIARFEKETGIKVVYDVYDANEILEAKLMVGSSGYDVVFPSARPFAERHIKSDLYQPIDRTQLDNYKNLDPVILQSLTDIDPDNTYLVPYMWGTTGLGYNVKKVTERLGDIPLDSWSLLFDPNIATQLQDCGISVLDDEQEGLGAALLYAGQNPNTASDEMITQVSAMYQSIHPFIRYFNSSQYIDDLANGEICLAMGYNGDVLQARDRAKEANNGVEIRYIIPKEGALRWVDNIAIPKDATHPHNAHLFINFMLRADVIAPISNYVSYASANQAAKELVDPEISNDPGIYPPEQLMVKLVDPQSPPEEKSRERVRMWTSIKSGE